MTPRYEPLVDMHPEEIWALLESLSPTRPPLPWETKVERLLNGLKDRHQFIGRNLSDRAPWLLHQQLLRTHAHILGGTGSGKTSLCLVPLIIQLIAQAESSMVVFDMKGDNFLWATTFIEAARAGLPFRWFTIEHGAASFAFNPFTQQHNQKRTLNARAQSLLVSLGLYYGEAFGKTFFQSISLDTLTAFLAKFRDIRSFADLAKYAESRASYRATNTDEENSQHLRMVLRQLAAVEPLNVTAESTVRPEVLRDAIDMTDVLTRKQVVFFSLPSLEEELTAKSIGKLGLYALVHAAKILNRTTKSLPCYTFLDEFQQICAENIKILLEMARSMGIYLVLSHQDMSQLKTADYDITSTVESCTTFKVALESSSLAALKQMEEYSGEARERTISWAQPIHAGFDEDSDEALSPDHAHPNEESGVPMANVGERERSRITRNEILDVSAQPLRAFVRSRTDSGLTQYHGQWTAIEMEYCTTQSEHEARSKTPLPRQHPSCVTVGAGQTDGVGEPAPGLPNNPLPVTPPPSVVDAAIAERLQELQEKIRTQHKKEPGEP